MYIFPGIGHNSVKNLLITLHCEATIYEEHLLTSVVILYQGRLKKVHMSKWTINDFPNNTAPTLYREPKCEYSKISAKIHYFKNLYPGGVRTCLAPPFTSVTGNKGTV